MSDLKRCKVYYLGIAKQFKDVVKFYSVHSIFPMDFNAGVESVFCGKNTIDIFKKLSNLRSPKIEDSFGDYDGIDFFVNENLPPDTFMVVSNELYRNPKSFGPFDNLNIIWAEDTAPLSEIETKLNKISNSILDLESDGIKNKNAVREWIKYYYTSNENFGRAMDYIDTLRNK